MENDHSSSRTDNTSSVFTHTPDILTSHPLNEDVDVSVVLCGSQAAHYVGMAKLPQHCYLLLEALQLLLLLLCSVADIANLQRTGGACKSGHSLRRGGRLGKARTRSTIAHLFHCKHGPIVDVPGKVAGAEGTGANHLPLHPVGSLNVWLATGGGCINIILQFEVCNKLC